jgi:hypothetical protein
MTVGGLEEMRLAVIVSNFRELCGANSSQISVIRLMEIGVSRQPCLVRKDMSCLDNLSHP